MFLFLLIKISTFRKAVLTRSLFLPSCFMLNQPLSPLKWRQELNVMYGQDYFPAKSPSRWLWLRINKGIINVTTSAHKRCKAVQISALRTLRPERDKLLRDEANNLVSSCMQTIYLNNKQQLRTK